MAFLETDLAYAAGVIDGDGCICVSRQKRKAGRPYYCVQVLVSMKLETVPIWFQKTFGGTARLTQPAKNKPKFCPMWRWGISGRKSIDLLSGIIPHLKLKKRRAEFALQLVVGMLEVQLRNHLGHRLPIDEAETARREKLATLIREENFKTNKRVGMYSQVIQ